MLKADKLVITFIIEFLMKLEYGLITWRVIIPVSLIVIMTVNVSSKCAAVWNHDKFSVTCSVKVRLSSVTTATVTSQVGRKPSAVWRRHQVFIISGKVCDTDVFIGRICPEHKLCSPDSDFVLKLIAFRY